MSAKQSKGRTASGRIKKGYKMTKSGQVVKCAKKKSGGRRKKRKR